MLVCLFVFACYSSYQFDLDDCLSYIESQLGSSFSSIRNSITEQWVEMERKYQQKLTAENGKKLTAQQPLCGFVPAEYIPIEISSSPHCFKQIHEKSGEEIIAFWDYACTRIIQAASETDEKEVKTENGNQQQQHSSDVELFQFYSLIC